MMKVYTLSIFFFLSVLTLSVTQSFSLSVETRTLSLEKSGVYKFNTRISPSSFKRFSRIDVIPLFGVVQFYFFSLPSLAKRFIAALNFFEIYSSHRSGLSPPLEL